MTVCVREREVVLYDSSHVLLNKPPGCMTDLKDRDLPVAYDFLAGAPLNDELRPVGRLDLDTTGLLLWTTDGFWLQRLTHPKRKVPRTYNAALSQPFVAPPRRCRNSEHAVVRLVALLQVSDDEIVPRFRWRIGGGEDRLQRGIAVVPELW